MQNLNPGSYARVAVIAAVAIAAGLFSRAVWPVQAGAVGASPASNVTVTCAPDQQALVQQVPVGTETQTAVRCVGTSAQYGYGSVDPAAVPVRSGYVQPAVLTSAAPQDFVTAPAPAPRVATVRAPVRKRSWQKTALVIGGSTGAGAGIGGLAGGKKGALIGAAIGGGAASIYEAVKRR
jgi:hypothetical protein